MKSAQAYACPIGQDAETKFSSSLKGKQKRSQPYVREEKLDRQLSQLLQKFSLRPDWAAGLRDILAKDEKEAAQSSAAFVQEARGKIKNIQIKLQTDERKEVAGGANDPS